MVDRCQKSVDSITVISGQQRSSTCSKLVSIPKGGGAQLEVRQGYLVCGNSGRSNQTVSIRTFVLHRFDVWVHPFTKFQRTW